MKQEVIDNLLSSYMEDARALKRNFLTESLFCEK